MFKAENGTPIPPAKTAAADRRQQIMKKAATELEAARPQITRLAQHRVALAYSIAKTMPHVASSVNGRKSVTAHLLTMPTFALQGLFDMHKAAEDEMQDESLLPALDGEAPAVEDAPAPAVEDAPAPEGDAPAADPDAVGDPLADDLGGEDAPVDPELQDLAAENTAVVQDIAALEQDFSELQEAMPSGAQTVDLSSILGEDSFDDKASQLPGEGEEGEIDQLTGASVKHAAEDETDLLETVAPDGNLNDVINPLDTNDLVDALKQASKQMGNTTVYELGEGLDAIGMTGQSYATQDSVITTQPNKPVHDSVKAVPSNTTQKPGHQAATAPKKAGATQLPVRPLAHVASANDGQVDRLGALLGDFSKSNSLY